MRRALVKAARELHDASTLEGARDEFVLDIAWVHVTFARIQQRLNCFAELVKHRLSFISTLYDRIPKNDDQMVREHLNFENE